MKKRLREEEGLTPLLRKKSPLLKEGGFPRAGPSLSKRKKQGRGEPFVENQDEKNQGILKRKKISKRADDSPLLVCG